MSHFEKYDAIWKESAERNGWNLPTPSHWMLRLPVIRRIRYIWLMFKLEIWYSRGPGSIGIRTGYDDWVAYAIARGWC